MERKLSKIQLSRKIYRAKGAEDINSLLKKSMEDAKIEMRGPLGNSRLDNASAKEALSEHYKELK